MSHQLKMSRPTSEDAFCYEPTNNYVELRDMILDWLEEYRQLEPLLEQMCSRVSEEKKLEPSLKLSEKIADDRSSSNRSQI